MLGVTIITIRSIMLRVVMLNVIMLRVVMLKVNMLRVIIYSIQKQFCSVEERSALANSNTKMHQYFTSLHPNQKPYF
jgi:hypothetical protein